jgi:hypothetical protein
MGWTQQVMSPFDRWIPTRSTDPAALDRHEDGTMLLDTVLGRYLLDAGARKV